MSGIPCSRASRSVPWFVILIVTVGFMPPQLTTSGTRTREEVIWPSHVSSASGEKEAYGGIKKLPLQRSVGFNNRRPEKLS